MTDKSVGTIKENIKYIIECQKNIGSHMPAIVNPSGTDEEIKEAEKVTKTKSRP